MRISPSQPSASRSSKVSLEETIRGRSPALKVLAPGESRSGLRASQRLADALFVLGFDTAGGRAIAITTQSIGVRSACALRLRLSQTISL